MRSSITSRSAPRTSTRVAATVSVGLPAVARRSDARCRAVKPRASLAAILLSRYDVFLLDEPTNDLDFAGLDLLESFLAELAGGVVIVSTTARSSTAPSTASSSSTSTRTGAATAGRLARLPRGA
jgi:ABC-type transport system involved in cytochrome c biogenesis ATPase subunit